MAYYPFRPDIPALQALAAARNYHPGENSKVGAIIRDFRPSAYALANGGRPFDENGAIRDFSPAEIRLMNDIAETASPSVGRIEICRDGGWHASTTCFRIGETGRLIATAGHAMNDLLLPGATVMKAMPVRIHSTTTAPLRAARVNFNPLQFRNGVQVQQDDPKLIFPLGPLRACHSRWDLLVAEVGPGNNNLPGSLHLAQDPEWGSTDGNGILILGFPDRDEAQRHEAFANVFGSAGGDFGLQASPGRLHQPLPQLPLPPDFDVLAACSSHDATTLHGSSGSPVISLDSLGGKFVVVGIHFDGGRYEPDEMRQIGSYNRAVNLPVALIEEQLSALMVEGADDAKIKSRPITGWVPDRPSWTADLPAGSHEAAWAAQTDTSGNAPDLFMGVVPDRPDFRDYIYQSGLAIVPPRHWPGQIPAGRIRDQGNSFACTGFALAAAIDLQLGHVRGDHKADAASSAVSERMLYECARLNDEWVDGGRGGSSLRAAIKGFYQNGVCAQTDAPWVGSARWALTRKISLAARQVTLGAYFRLAPELLAFQAALVEVGSVLVSAHIHRGWKTPRGGKIRLTSQKVGAHAFVLLGFDETGFIVQNSWGPGWGRFDGRAGIAHWSYEDWAENLIDAWVLRLAPGQPGTFDLRPRIASRAAPQTDTAAAAGRPGPLPIPRRHSLIGHLVTCEAGGFTASGPISAGLGALRETALYLATEQGKKKYKRIAFFLHDPFLGSEPLARIAGAMIDPLTRRGVYPLHIFYGLSEIETIRLRLLHEASQAAGRYAADPTALGSFITLRARNTAKPLWDAWLVGAGRAARRGGSLWTSLAALLLESDVSRQSSICAIGSGAMLAMALHAEGAPDHLQRGFDRNVLIAPTIDRQERAALWRRQTRLWRLPSARPSHPAIPGFHGDWPDLVSGAFRSGETLVRRPSRDMEPAEIGSDLPATEILGSFEDDAFREELARRL